MLHVNLFSTLRVCVPCISSPLGTVGGVLVWNGTSIRVWWTYPWTFLGENWEVWDMCLDVFGDVWMPIIQTDAHVALVLLTKHLLNVLTLV